jgi:hypothetical protein
MKRAKPHPVIAIFPPEPSPAFIAWVAQYGPIRLARSLGIARSAVHCWVSASGKRCRPRVDAVMHIVALSGLEPLNGTTQLTVEDILGEPQIVKLEMRR